MWWGKVAYVYSTLVMFDNSLRVLAHVYPSTTLHDKNLCIYCGKPKDMFHYYPNKGSGVTNGHDQHSRLVKKQQFPILTGVIHLNDINLCDQVHLVSALTNFLVEAWIDS